MPLHRFFAAHEPLVRAAVTAPLLRPVWAVVRDRRDAGVRAAMAEATRTLDPQVAAADGPYRLFMTLHELPPELDVVYR